MNQYDARMIPPAISQAADKAIRGLLVLGLTRERVASLAGKLIDHIGRQLEEEKREQERRLAVRKTALGKLLAKEQRKRQRKRKNGKLATDRHG